MTVSRIMVSTQRCYNPELYRPSERGAEIICLIVRDGKPEFCRMPIRQFGKVKLIARRHNIEIDYTSTGHIFDTFSFINSYNEWRNKNVL